MHRIDKLILTLLSQGSVWSRLGSKVTVVEFLDKIGGPGMDADMARAMERILKKQHMEFKLKTKVIGGDTSSPDKITISTEPVGGGDPDTIDTDVVLVAIGRRPYTYGLGLENIGLETDERGRIVIDQEYRTNIPHIRVIGDVTFGAMLAHKVILTRFGRSVGFNITNRFLPYQQAEEEGIAAVEYISRGYGHVNYGAIPSVMYTYPEAAWVGQTEQEVIASARPYSVGTFPFSANSRAKTNLETDGMVK